MPRQRVVKPDDLGDHGSKFWDLVMASMRKTIRVVDTAALRMACKWLDRFERDGDSDAKGIEIKLGIATDKFLEISKRFGFTPADRLKTPVESSGKPKAAEKKTALDALVPGKLEPNRVDQPAD